MIPRRSLSVLALSLLFFIGALALAAPPARTAPATARPATQPTRLASPRPAARPSQAAPQAAAPATQQFKPGPDRVLWDAWYTVTVNKNIHYAYYNERFEIRQGKVFYQLKTWKQEEGYLNEEQLGALSEYGPDFVPLFFNFHSTYRTTETTIDGNVQNGRLLTVKIRKANTDLPIVKKGVPSRCFLQSFFPLWLGMRLPNLKAGQKLSFMTILEDNIEVGWSAVTGNVRLEASDPMATKLKAYRISIDYRDLRTTWYVDGRGMPLRFEIPGQKTVVERVTEDAAKAFLED